MYWQCICSVLALLGVKECFFSWQQRYSYSSYQQSNNIVLIMGTLLAHYNVLTFITMRKIEDYVL